jgi:hypothetical protein
MKVKQLIRRLSLAAARPFFRHETSTSHCSPAAAHAEVDGEIQKNKQQAKWPTQNMKHVGPS